jgi:hypothetical protein
MSKQLFPSISRGIGFILAITPADILGACLALLLPLLWTAQALAIVMLAGLGRPAGLKDRGVCP